MSLRLSGIRLSYGGTRVIQDLSLDVESGEMVALLGASGSGKTTVLKLIAGLLPPDRGVIQINGTDVQGVPAELRHAAVVFQKPLLFPFLSVAENVGFSLKLKGASAATIRERVGEALEMVRLEGYESRRPSELSGGQEQRVSLARALVSEPRILLLDEPFAALDENLRVEIRSLVRAIQRRIQLTTVFVTHDRNEAAVVAHRIAFLHDGGIAQVGPLRDFYENPVDLATAKFFGWQILPEGETFRAVRADAVRIVPEGLEATVESSIDLGIRVSTTVRLRSGATVEFQHDPPELDSGRTIAIAIDTNSTRVFARTARN